MSFDLVGTPWGHQLDAMAMAEKKRDFALFFEPGCISGDAVVRVNRRKISRSMTLAELYHKFNRIGADGRSCRYMESSPTYIRSFLGDRVGLNEIKQVLYSGEKEVFRIRLEGAAGAVKATGDHEILTRRGWVQIGRAHV